MTYIKSLLNKWKPEKWVGKTIKLVLHIITTTIGLMFLAVPFLPLKNVWLECFKWIWIGCVTLNLDLFAQYKSAKKEKLFRPYAFLFILLILVYLYNFWHLLSLLSVITLAEVALILEGITTIYLYKTFRISLKQKNEELSDKKTEDILFAGIYVCSLELFISSLHTNQTTMYVFGIISVIMLFSWVIVTISNGFEKRRSKSISGYMALDIITLLALIGYLLYHLPNGPENNNLQEIALSLTSAVIGGALTLAGVAWTIKKTEQVNRQQEIQKAKPFFHFLASLSDNIPDTQMICYANIPTTVEKPIMNIVHLINSDNSNFYIREIKYLGKWYTVEISNCVIKNRDICLILQTDSETWDGKYIIVRIEDILGNSYYYVFGFATHENENHEKYNSISCIQEVPEEFAKQ